MRRHAGVAAEVVLLLGVLSAVNLAWPERPGFVGVEPHPYYGVVLLVTVRYGFVAGMGGAALASALYFAQLVIGLDAPSWRDFLAFEYARPAVVMGAGAALVGLVADGHLRRVRALEETLDALRAERGSLARDQARLRDVNAELAERVSRADSTLPVLYRYVRRLNVADQGGIHAALVDVLRDAMGARQASVYTVDGGRLTKSAGGGPPMPRLTEPAVRRLLAGQVLTLRDVAAGPGEAPPLFMAGPLREGPEGPVVAVLTVDDIDFERYTQAALRLFRVLVDWAAYSLAHARVSGTLADGVLDLVTDPSGSLEAALATELAAATVPGDRFVQLLDELGTFLEQEPA